MVFERSLLTKAGRFQSTAEIRLPPEFASGNYHINYGLYHGRKGHRVPLKGVGVQHRRMHAGTLRITGQNDSYIPAKPPLLDSNVNAEGTMLDFGPLATDGAFRLIHDDNEWRLVPLPSNRPFHTKIRLSAFGAVERSVKSIEIMDPLCKSACKPQWTQKDGVLSLSCDSLSFGYRILFNL